MLCARRLETLEVSLRAGQQPSAAELEVYARLSAFCLAMALELFKYEYGRLPLSSSELEAEDYFDQWPSDPARGWQPLELAVNPAVPRDAVVELIYTPGSLAFSLRCRAADGRLLLDYASPEETWYETEARLQQRDYLAFEQSISAMYADRRLWPASGVVRPPEQRRH